MIVGNMPSPSPLSLSSSSHARSRQVSIVDACACGFVLLMGVFEATHYTHAADFLQDPTYVDLAKSIAVHGSYQISSLPETTLPPGFALVLALVGRFCGFTPAALFPVTAICAALGTVLAYLLIRRVQGKGIAAAACVLFASSATVFIYNTAGIFPEMPYFLASMLVLLLALHIDTAKPGKFTVAWEILLGVVLGLAILIRSIGIALLIALVLWIIVSWMFDGKTGKRRMVRLSAAITFGLAAQLSWTLWSQRHQVLEWQLPGYPESYISQLRVKDGNDPELGSARLSDIPPRIERNLLTRALEADQQLSGRYISNFWPSPAIAGVVILIFSGLAFSLRNGGQLCDWYYLSYEGIFLLWPWNTEKRFLFPILPLFCLYLWRGILAWKNYLVSRPRQAGISLAIAASILSAGSAAFLFHLAAFAGDPNHSRADHIQPIAAALFWAITAIFGLAWFTHHSLAKPAVDERSPAHRRGMVIWLRPQLAFNLLAITLVGALVLENAAMVLRTGRDNLRLTLTTQTTYPDIEAATWIRAHEPSGHVIMARFPELIYHYTQGRIVWLPPISDARVLMDGVRRLHVGVIVAIHRSRNYWVPAEDVSIQNLLRAYPNSFHLSHQGPNSWIYDVVKADTAQPRAP